ncbi:MAG: antitoxin family protein [Microcoleus sp. SU_5_3]|nr:antitoxin family protein [Microcoleus sp. SU_5_3]
MPETIAAVYENGMLRPLTPLSLNDGETVQIQIIAETQSEEIKGDRELATKLREWRGLIRLPRKKFQLDAATEKKRRELFEKLKGRVGKPLSEIVIEDRGPW